MQLSGSVVRTQGTTWQQMSMQLLSARWVVTVEPSGQVLENHTVVVDDGKIVDVLSTDEAKIKYGSVPDSQRWEGKESVLLPGFVNCHTHSAMTLLRGIADDLSLMPWLHEHIWPAEGALVSPDFVYDGTKLAMAEMLRSGTTCFNDMYFFPDAVPPQPPPMRPPLQDATDLVARTGRQSHE